MIQPTIAFAPKEGHQLEQPKISPCLSRAPAVTRREKRARINRWPAPVPGYLTNNGMVMPWADRPIYLVRGCNRHPEDRRQVWEQAAKVEQ